MMSMQLARARPGRAASILVAVVLLAGCTSTGSPTGGGGGTGTPAGGGPTQAPATEGGGGGGKSAGQIDACSLLTPAEIEQALGAPMKAGEPSSVSGDASGCKWAAQEETAGLEVDITITPFDQDLWDGETTVQGSEAVPGIGDAAFRGFVSPGVLLIKVGNLEVDIQIVAVFLDVEKVKSAQTPLAKLVLSRL